MGSVRCECHSKLAEFEGDVVLIKCKKCKRVSVIKLIHKENIPNDKK